MPAVRLSDTIRRRLEAEGRLPSDPGRAEREHRRAALAVADRSARSEDYPGTLAWQARADGLPAPLRELCAIPGRRYRFDLAWPEFRVAVEVDGGVHTVGEDGQQGGRHQRPAGFEADCEKLSLAAAHGWRVLKCTPRQVADGRAVRWLRQALLGGPPWE